MDEALGRVIGGGRGHGHPHRLALHEKHMAGKGGLCGGAVRTGVWGWGTGKGGGVRVSRDFKVVCGEGGVGGSYLGEGVVAHVVAHKLQPLTQLHHRERETHTHLNA